jgi:hypothetical protein
MLSDLFGEPEVEICGDGTSNDSSNLHSNYDRGAPKVLHGLFRACDFSVLLGVLLFTASPTQA